MTPRPRILVTAFEPFDSRAANRSQLWLEAFLDRARDSGLAHRVDLSAAILPVDYRRLPRALARLWRSERPDAWILTGEAGAGDALRVERVAVNVLDAPIPDNAGRMRRDAAVVRGGPAAYFATVDVRRIAATLQKDGARAVVSLSAGSYCCNQAYYVVRHLAATSRRPGAKKARVVFLHVPRLPLLRSRPAPRIAAAADGLVRVVRALAAAPRSR